MSPSEHTLEMLCERITVGHVGKMSDQYVDHGGVVFLRSQDIKPFTISRGSANRVRADFAASLRKSELRAGDVVVVRTGYPGTAAVVPEELHGSNCADLVVITPGPELDAHFLAGVFNSVFGQRLVAGRLVGAAQQHFNVSAAKGLRLHLPPYRKQKQIGAAIARVCELIENNQRRIEVLEELTRLIYREWFVHFRFPGHEEVEFVRSDLGTIPTGWQTTTLDAVANVNERSLRAGDPVGEILYLDISSVGPRTIEAPEAMEFSRAPGRARRLVAAGDTVWSTVRPNRRSHALLVDPPPNLVCSTGFAVLTPRTVPSSYLFELTSTDEFTAHLTGLATGSAYPAVRPADFECYPLALPPAELLDQYDTVVGPMHRLQHTLSEQNRVLSAARDLLLPRLIAGELDVSDLDLDLEPVA